MGGAISGSCGKRLTVVSNVSAGVPVWSAHRRRSTLRDRTLLAIEQIVTVLAQIVADRALQADGLRE